MMNNHLFIPTTMRFDAQQITDYAFSPSSQGLMLSDGSDVEKDDTEVSPIKVLVGPPSPEDMENYALKIFKVDERNQVTGEFGQKKKNEEPTMPSGAKGTADHHNAEQNAPSRKMSKEMKRTVSELEKPSISGIRRYRTPLQQTFSFQVPTVDQQKINSDDSDSDSDSDDFMDGANVETLSKLKSFVEESLRISKEHLEKEILDYTRCYNSLSDGVKVDQDYLSQSLASFFSFRFGNHDDSYSSGESTLTKISCHLQRLHDITVALTKSEDKGSHTDSLTPLNFPDICGKFLTNLDYDGVSNDIQLLMSKGLESTPLIKAYRVQKTVERIKKLDQCLTELTAKIDQKKKKN